MEETMDRLYIDESARTMPLDSAWTQRSNFPISLIEIQAGQLPFLTPTILAINTITPLQHHHNIYLVITTPSHPRF